MQLAADFGTGEVFLSMLWFFLFFIWIWMLIVVFGDIFSSPDLSGWGKALWTVFVIVLPYLGVFVYLIARGRGMAERSARKQVEYETHTAEEYRQISFASPSEEIAKAQALRDQGVISDGEFEAIKAKALGSKF